MDNLIQEIVETLVFSYYVRKFAGEGKLETLIDDTNENIILVKPRTHYAIKVECCSESATWLGDKNCTKCTH